MNAWKTITLAGAMLALAAPAANASFDKVLPSKTPHVTNAGKAKAKTKAHPSGNVVVMIIAPPLPAGSQPQPAEDPLLACESTGADCTDAQLCSIWGMNCDVAAAELANQQAAEDQTSRP